MVIIGLILYGPSRPKSESLADMDLLMLFSDIVDFVSICLFCVYGGVKVYGVCFRSVGMCVLKGDVIGAIFWNGVGVWDVWVKSMCIQRFCSIACFKFC